MRIVSVLLCFLFCALGLAEESPKSEEKLLLPHLKEIEVAGPYCVSKGHLVRILNWSGIALLIKALSLTLSQRERGRLFDRN